MANPAAGQEQPVLGPLNDVWGPAGVRWTVSVTLRDGDAETQAREAAGRGCDVVCVFGGDGTVSAVATGLLESGVPMGILPGGTGNAAAQELGIPTDLREAAALAVRPDACIRRVDVLRFGERVALLRVGVGFDARTVTGATRELKDQIGWFAYPLAALRELGRAAPSPLVLELDDECIETDAFAVVVANVGRMGRGGARFPGRVDPFDGRADVYVLRSMDLGALVTVAARMLRLSEQEAESEEHDTDPLWHRTARHVRVSSPEVALPVHADGDPAGETPLALETLPGALELVLPGPETAA